jgi:hypothetical protein
MNCDYKVKRSKLTRKQHVHYGCPNCGTRLRSPYDAAGNRDTCPECQAVFVVPGREDFEADRLAEEFVDFAKTESENAAATRTITQNSVGPAARRTAVKSTGRLLAALSGFAAGMGAGFAAALLVFQSAEISRLSTELELIKQEMQSNEMGKPERTQQVGTPADSLTLPSPKQLAEILRSIGEHQKLTHELLDELGVEPQKP